MIEWLTETSGRVRLGVGLVIMAITGVIYLLGYVWPWGFIVGIIAAGSALFGEF